MKWRGRKRSSNIEDRRGQRTSRSRGQSSGFGGRRVRMPRARTTKGTLALLGIIIIISWVMGVNPISLLDGSIPNSPSNNSASEQPRQNAEQDELVSFVSVVIKENEDLWDKIFTDSGLHYDEPKLVLFTGATRSACGAANASTGPFYCPADQKIYIDLAFYDQLRKQFGAPGDFAQAYVLAHEVGHHVQQLTGVLPEFNKARPRLSKVESNEWSVRVELQADCYAGVWAAYAGQEDLLERGDIEEALNAANSIGDDTIQKRMQGFAVPKLFRMAHQSNVNIGLNVVIKRAILQAVIRLTRQGCRAVLSILVII